MSDLDKRRIVDSCCPTTVELGLEGAGRSKRQYFLPLPGGNLSVCQSLWDDVYLVSKMFHSRLAKQVPGGVPRQRLMLKTRSVDEWLSWIQTLHEQMPDTVGAGRDDAKPSVIAPHRQTGVLLAFASKKDVYAAYCDDVGRKMEQPHLSREALRQLFLLLDKPASKSLFMTRWRSHHPHIKLRRSTRFAKCDTCVTLRECIQDRTGRGTVQEVAAARVEHSAHLRDIRTERQCYHEKRKEAVERPQDALSIILDGADQGSYGQLHTLAGATLFRLLAQVADRSIALLCLLPYACGGYPWFKEHSKTSSGIFKQKYHLIGALVHGIGPWIYTMSHQFAADSNVTIEVLQRVLTDLETELYKGRSFPPKLYLQMDNCVRENKNVAVLAYLSWLVQRRIFQQVFISFLPVGHTHEDIDQVWSRTSIKMRGNNVCCEEELFTLIKDSFHHYGYSARCAPLDRVANIRDWIAPHCEALYGYAGREVQHLRIFWHEDGPAIQTKKRSGEDWTDTPYDTPSKGFHLLKKCTPAPPFGEGVIMPPPLALKESPPEMIQRLQRALEVIQPDSRVSAAAYRWLLEALRKLENNRPLLLQWEHGGQLLCERIEQPPSGPIALVPPSAADAAARLCVERDADSVDEKQQSGETVEEDEEKKDEALEASRRQGDEEDTDAEETDETPRIPFYGLRTHAQEIERRALVQRAQDEVSFHVEKLSTGHFVVFVPEEGERKDDRCFWVGQVQEDWTDEEGVLHSAADRITGIIHVHNYTPYTVRKGAAASNNIAGQYGDYTPDYEKGNKVSWTTCKWEQVLFVLSHLLPHQGNPNIISGVGPRSWFSLPNYLKVKLQAIFHPSKGHRPSLPKRSRREPVWSGLCVAQEAKLSTRDRLTSAKRAVYEDHRNMSADDQQGDEQEQDSQEEEAELATTVLLKRKLKVKGGSAQRKKKTLKKTH